MSSAYHLETAFEELNSLARFHPSKGYSWENRRPGQSTGPVTAPPPSPVKVSKRDTEEASSQFQRLRVDMLLVELTRKFPLPLPQTLAAAAAGPQNSSNNQQIRKYILITMVKNKVYSLSMKSLNK